MPDHSSPTRPSEREPIAVVGIAHRFPGANDTPDEFADFLRANGSGIVPLPTDRWGGAVGVGSGPGEIRTSGGGFLDRIDEFDAPFFNIAPKQAHYIDPQQRLLLETAWTALEDANVDPSGLRHGNGGVYIGATPFDYALELERLSYPELDGALATGIGGYSMCGRLSYFLGWRGPSLTTDTACASALTALHLAVEGLRAAECDIALCGAVNVLHHPRIFSILSNGQVLAEDGRCKTFDEAADGYARAEGCGVLVLKRLSAALADGDPIRAVIRGTAIGQDGESAGLTAPNGAAQQQAMRLALRRAAVAPGDIQYVEAHGTGTPLGDPLELSSIDAVLGAAHRNGPPLLVGSVKANIGHMEPAAGMGGLIKVILMMRDGVIFPHRYDVPSARVPWETYPITVPTTPVPWTGRPRRAMVNSFGLAGAIGVVVLEEPPPTSQPTNVDGGWSVFTLSAKSRPALSRQVRRYRDFVAARSDVPIADICRTRNLGRSHFRHRVAGLVTHHDDLAGLLERATDELAGDGRPPPDVRKTAFLFTGSGAQYRGMGAGLYQRFAEFARCVDDCDELFWPHVGRSVRDLVFGAEQGDPDPLLGTVAGHAALFTVEYALARLLLSWGVRPNVLLGHSVGEVIAATVAGLFTLPDGVALLAARAELIESVPVAGGMVAVATGADVVEPLLAGEPLLSIGAINAPDRCVVSGASADLDRVAGLLSDRGHAVTPLAVSSAFHSPLMADIAAQLRDVVAGLRPGEPDFTLVSNLTGAPAGPAELSDPDYWARHLCEPVNFAAGMRAVAQRGRHAVIELGPSATLTTLARRCVPVDGQLWLSCLRRGDETGQTLGRSLARLYTAGAKLDWAAVHADDRGRSVALPTYAFERRRYWIPAGSPARSGQSLLGAPVGANGDRHTEEFSTRISTGRPAYLADHTSAGRAFLPAMVCVELALAVGDARHGHTRMPLTDLRFDEALPLSDRPTELRTRTTTRPDGTIEVAVLSRVTDAADAAWRRHASAVVGDGRSTRGTVGENLSPAGAALRRFAADPGAPTGRMDTEQIYAAYARAGLDYGAEFRRAGQLVRYGSDLVVGEVSGLGVAADEHAPPPVLDAVTHGLAMLAGDGRRYVSVGIAEVRVFRKPRAAVLRSVLLRLPAAGTGVAFTVDALLLDGEQPVAELRGMAFRELPTPVARQPVSDNGKARPDAGRGGRRHAAIREVIRTTVADLLRIDDPADIDEHATFLELGLDSLVGLQVKAVLENRFAVPLGSSVVFDHPTTADLADFLDRMSHASTSNENG